LKVPARQPKQARLWLPEGPCVRLRAEGADHVRLYDFVHHRTCDGRVFRALNVLNEFARESPATRARLPISQSDVIEGLTDLFLLRGFPDYIRSDNGPEFVFAAVRQWTAGVGPCTPFIELGSP